MAHKHTWIIALVQGSSVLVECQGCSAIVGAEVSPHELGGHAFMFAALRGSLTDAEFMQVSDLVTARFAPQDRYRLHMAMPKRSRRRFPGRTA